MATAKWCAASRCYETERERCALPREETTNHPLKAITVTVSESKIRNFGKGSGTSRSSSISSERSSERVPLSFEGTDPLSQLAAETTSMDPLSQIAAKMSISKARPSRTASLSSSNSDDTFEAWSAKRAPILSHYSTSEKLSITTSFLSAADKEIVAVKSQPSTVSDKVKNRLEQLDDFEEGSVQEMLNLSQQEYVKRIDELNRQLISAWHQDQRVKSLKIAIQCAKLLADVSVILFYPSKFVLVTDILDTFGDLVYNRIKNKACGAQKGAKLPDNFTVDQVPESAKETCRNWFFKIASIRELLPRFYVEAAILKCFNFLTTSEYKSTLLRLARMSRGIGDPLVAIYARCYLCRVGILVAPKIKDHLMPCFNDFITTHSQIQGDSVQDTLALQKLELSRYLTLYSPALDWLLQCLALHATECDLVDMLDKCQSSCNSALLLNSIMTSFKPEYISPRANQITQMILTCKQDEFPLYLLYRTLGTCLVSSPPPEKERLGLLNDVWKVVTKYKKPEEYISCAEVWIEYVVKNFSKREVNTFLKDILKHMQADRAYEDHYPQLRSVMSKILAHIHDFTTLFSLDKFLSFIDIFQKESVKVEVCKNIMESYVRHQTEPVTDPVIINTLMFLCKTMHDAEDALSLQDEVRQTANLINGFLRTVSYGRDFEQQLNFFVEARATFSNLDPILVHLVQSVNRLIMETRKIVRGNHSRKTASFVRACVAYCFITIPSLNAIFSRLNLYLLSGQIAVLNQCFAQGDAFFKAAISLLPEVPLTIELDNKIRSTEPLLVEYLNNFVSALLVVPDNPDQGVLYLLRGLLNATQAYAWDPDSTAKSSHQLGVMSMLAASCQQTYIYNIDKVDSNDALYGHDAKYIAEATRIASTLLEQVLQTLADLNIPESYKQQSQLALELFNQLVIHSDLQQEELFCIAVKMWKLTLKHSQLDTKLMVRTLNHIKQKASESGDTVFADLAASMPLQSRA